MQNSKLSNTKSIASLSSKGKVGFFSTVLISINSTIGSGIFFKTNTILEYSSSSLFFEFFSWFVACIGIICMAIAICELTSTGCGNMGISGWCKKFSSRYIYGLTKNFLIYIYGPLMCFFTSIFAIKYFQEFLSDIGAKNNFGTCFDWIIWSLIAFAIVSWFFFTTGISAKVANIQNWILTGFKFVLIISPIALGSYILIIGEGKFSSVQFWPEKMFDGSAIDLFKLTPFLGLFGSLAAIVFAYGGFYSVVSLRNEMKQPSKNGKAILVAVAIISGIYLTIAIIMTFSSSSSGIFGNFFEKHQNLTWIRGLINLTISIGTLGIINGAVVFSVNLVHNMINSGEIIFPFRLLGQSAKKQLFFSSLYIYSIFTFFFFLMATIGGLGYFVGSSNHSRHDAEGFYSMAKLINFADFISNWAIIFVFLFICFAIYGALKKRKNDPTIKTNKVFSWVGWISFILISISSICSVLHPLVNMFLAILNTSKFSIERAVGNGLGFALFILFSLISLVPIFFEKRIFEYRLHFLENLLLVISKLKYSKTKSFTDQGLTQKINTINQLGIDDLSIHCIAVARCHLNNFLKNNTSYANFSKALEKNISEIKSFLNYLK